MQIPEVVKLVTKATLYARGGEIFLPKMKAFRLGDLLEVVVDRIAPRLGIKSQDIELKVTGLIKGEKLHEDLINKTEAGRIYELDDMYAILESEQAVAKYREIKKVAVLEYTSRNVPLVSKDEIEKTVLDYLQNYLAVGRN
jgi:FlaA1/EpsC-like NDP-sugar epimerase